MNTSKSMVVLMAAILPFFVEAFTVTVKNYDDDLATVYVDGIARTNGEVVAVGEQTTIELKDFQNDYYFKFAPEEQTDRTLSFYSWEGVPEGFENQNPATFNVTKNISLIPNVDVKGYAWVYYSDNSISNRYWKSGCNKTDTSRSVNIGNKIAVYVPEDFAGELVMDWVPRVLVNGKNYTITGLTSGDPQPLAGTKATVLRVPPALMYLRGQNFARNAPIVTNVIGLAETKITAYNFTALYASSSYFGKFNGPIMDFIPPKLETIGGSALREQSNLTGPLILPYVKSIGGYSFAGCSSITELYTISPNLTTLSACAFNNCTQLLKVTLASPVLSSVAVDVFNNAITNLTWLSAPPASREAFDNLIAKVAAVDGAHGLNIYLPMATNGWWSYISPLTEAEIAANPPTGTIGAYVTEKGGRKGWIISNDDVSSYILVTDQAKITNADYEIKAGLKPGDELTLSRAGFTSCKVEGFDFTTCTWTNISTVADATFQYKHDGVLKRFIWQIEGGVKLDVGVKCYGGSVTVEGDQPVVDNIYEQGASVVISANNRTEHPTSRFVRWEGIEGEDALSQRLTLTLTEAMQLRAVFEPDEWLYDSTTKRITDGEYTSSAAVTLNRVAKTVEVPLFTGGQNYNLLIDLSKPVYVPDDEDNLYYITSYSATADVYTRRIKFGPKFSKFTRSSTFSGNTVLEQLDGLGASSVTEIPGFFLQSGGAPAPITLIEREANEVVPIGVKAIARYGFQNCYKLIGTLRMPCLDNFQVYEQGSGDLFSNTADGVTNLVLTAESLNDMSGACFASSFPNLEELTLSPTNMTSCYNTQFRMCCSSLKRLRFLAHPPSVTALNDMLTPFSGFTSASFSPYSDRTTTSAKPLEIHCSRHIPAWRAIAAEKDINSDEWKNRPVGTWGIYQRAAGKRFYLVHVDSKYGKAPGFFIRVR